MRTFTHERHEVRAQGLGRQALIEVFGLLADIEVMGGRCH